MTNRYILAALLIVLSSYFSFAKNDINKIKNDNNFLKIVGTGKTEIIRIPPPAEFLSKSANNQGANIEVNYFSFPFYERQAFRYAMDIVESLIHSQKTIVINAYWTDMSSGTLGSCAPTYYYSNNNGFTHPNFYFPSPLAEKLSLNGVKDDPAEADMVIYINKEVDWYIETDGNCPADQYDLVTVVLHEICHGLGITGNFRYENGIGSFGFGNEIPVIFDNFIYHKKAGELIKLDSYENYSSELGSALVSQNLIFQGPVTDNSLSSELKLYAPSIYSSGSSVYHVSPPFGQKELMNYSIGKGSAIHDPGPVTHALLDEIGWSALRLEHKKFESTEEINDVEIIVNITADFDTQIFNPTLYYSFDSTVIVAEPMVLHDTVYKATIPVNTSSNISYYITANDKYERVFSLPVNIEEYPFSFYIGEDTIVPAIEHMPISFLMPGQDSVVIAAKITDDFGIESSMLEYRLNEGEWLNVELDYQENDNYSVSIHFDESLKENDVFDYRIVVTDDSKNKNIAYLPKEDFFSILVEPIPDFILTYETDFEFENNDFMLQGFEITTAPEFFSPALQTPHPYLNAGENNSINYIAQLRYPILITEPNHYIRFDQIVLVEPGELGTIFGNDEFWDYVVVEGSKDGGKQWYPFVSGWDSRYNNEWEALYNSNMYQNNSLAIGTPDMYQSKTINMTTSARFSVGDTVLVRFRLFSDPYAYGWGWAIDNLEIQTPTLNVNNNTFTDADLLVYPNPIRDGSFRISFSDATDVLSISVMNLQGQVIYSTNKVQAGNTYYLPNTAQGVYILNLKTKQGIVSRKIMLM